LLLAVHWGHDGPPQSTPVSLPFLMPSEHVAFCPAAQTMRVVVFVVLVPGFVTSMLTETQLELTQSLPAMHVEPAAHLGHVGPPQSTPVSLPLETPSVQVAAGAALHVLLVTLQVAVRQSLLPLQLPPIAHLPHVVPPQSTPDSSPFLMPSVHVAAAHLFMVVVVVILVVVFVTVTLIAAQLLLRQSVLVTQSPLAGHLGHVGPPQSTPVSLLFLMPSPQPAGRAEMHMLLVVLQLPLRQSLALLQLTPVGHFGQVRPPQSTPVSMPFLTPSVHVAAAHIFIVVVVVTLVTGFVSVTFTGAQLLLRQSLGAEQPPLAAHLGHKGPPQSTPVSAPFLTPSEHDTAGAVMHAFVALSHSPVRQSALTLQLLPSPQAPQVEPPQSTPVSLPFLMPSEHVTAAQTLVVVFVVTLVVVLVVLLKLGLVTVIVTVVQLLLRQSLLALQLTPPAHAGQVPPQSTAISLPFCMPSEQEGGTGLQAPRAGPQLPA